jgi:hypothetical protein
MKPSLATPYPFKMLDRVSDVSLLSRNSCISQRLINQTSRRSDEGTAAPIFLISRLLSDKHEIRSCRSFAEDRLRGILVEIAAFARLCRPTQSLDGSLRWQEIGRGLTWFSRHPFTLSLY